MCVQGKRENVHMLIVFPKINSLENVKDSILGSISFCQYLDSKSDISLVKGGYSQGKWHISLSRCVCLKLIHLDIFFNKSLEC